MGAISRTLFEKARQVIPGGVNSPVRAFKAVGGDPPFFARGLGALLWDVDGNEYVDYVCSWGPLILGHAHPEIVREVQETVKNGTSFGAPNPHEVELARLVVDSVPGVEKVRMVNSGTEATLSALRLARAFTRRDLIVKMDGCYHGHVDALLVKAGSGVVTLGIPGTSGIPARVAEMTLVVPYNDLDVLATLVKERGKDIACVIVEPVAANMGVVPPRPGYLEGLREITSKHGILLIFDEVITGFRVALGGAQERYRITPDLTTLGKILGGGLPIGAYGGREEIMDRVAPEGDVYQAGTLAGGPLAMRAGIAMLKELRAPGVYDMLEKSSDRLARGLASAAEVRFATRPPISEQAVQSALQLEPGSVARENDGRLVLHLEPSPALVAHLSTWLEREGVLLTELRAGSRSLEQAFLDITGEAGDPEWQLGSGGE